MPVWYEMDRKEILTTLETTLEKGLNQTEAQHRLTQYGPNQLIERGLKTPWQIDLSRHR